MIILQPHIEPNTTSIERVGTWSRRICVHAHHPLFGYESLFISYRNPDYPFRLTLFMWEYDKLSIRLRFNNEKQFASYQASFMALNSEMAEAQKKPYPVIETIDLPHISDVQSPTYFKITGKHAPMYFANIDSGYYEVEYSLINKDKRIDLTPAPDVSSPHINCQTQDLAFYELAQVVSRLKKSFSLPDALTNDITGQLLMIQKQMMGFMSDLRSSYVENPNQAHQFIYPHMNDNKQSAYMRRIVNRLIQAGENTTALYLSQLFSQRHPEFIAIQHDAERALMTDPRACANRIEYLKYLIKIRTRILLNTRDPDDEHLLKALVDELSGGNGFISLEQRDNPDQLADMLIESALIKRNTRSLSHRAVAQTLIYSPIQTITPPSSLDSQDSRLSTNNRATTITRRHSI